MNLEKQQRILRESVSTVCPKRRQTQRTYMKNHPAATKFVSICCRNRRHGVLLSCLSDIASSPSLCSCRKRRESHERLARGLEADRNAPAHSHVADLLLKCSRRSAISSIPCADATDCPEE